MSLILQADLGSLVVQGRLVCVDPDLHLQQRSMLLTSNSQDVTNEGSSGSVCSALFSSRVVCLVVADMPHWHFLCSERVAEVHNDHANSVHELDATVHYELELDVNFKVPNGFWTSRKRSTHTWQGSCNTPCPAIGRDRCG